MFKTLY